ncbi:PD-(D/E)XK nuclease domain-containing protein [Parabacteroides distasonis]|nr:PD-(D/E)XK nuclease domain-containing protein [Parabacteroides distasonis]
MAYKHFFDPSKTVWEVSPCLYPSGLLQGETGSVQRVLQIKTTLYFFELKLDKSAQVAMKQIDLKDYKSKFALCGLPIVKVDINFDSEKRTIGEWKIEG